MTDNNSLTQPNYPSDYDRHSRRRWVAKGVMLLVLLFIAGLVSASRNALINSAQAEIVVPVETSIAPDCHPNHVSRDPGYAVVSYREAAWSDGARIASLRMF